MSIGGNNRYLRIDLHALYAIKTQPRTFKVVPVKPTTICPLDVEISPILYCPKYIPCMNLNRSRADQAISAFFISVCRARDSLGISIPGSSYSVCAQLFEHLSSWGDSKRWYLPTSGPNRNVMLTQWFLETRLYVHEGQLHRPQWLAQFVHPLPCAACSTYRCRCTYSHLSRTQQTTMARQNYYLQPHNHHVAVFRNNGSSGPCKILDGDRHGGE